MPEKLVLKPMARHSSFIRPVLQWLTGLLRARSTSGKGVRHALECCFAVIDETRAASPSTSGCENADVFAEAGRSVDEDFTSTRAELR